MTPEVLAKRLVDLLLSNGADPMCSSYVDDDGDLSDVVIDGHFDLLVVSRALLAELKL